MPEQTYYRLVRFSAAGDGRQGNRISDRLNTLFAQDPCITVMGLSVERVRPLQDANPGPVLAMWYQGPYGAPNHAVEFVSSRMQSAARQADDFLLLNTDARVIFMADVSYDQAGEHLVLIYQTIEHLTVADRDSVQGIIAPVPHGPAALQWDRAVNSIGGDPLVLNADTDPLAAGIPTLAVMQQRNQGRHSILVPCCAVPMDIPDPVPVDCSAVFVCDDPGFAPPITTNTFSSTEPPVPSTTTTTIPPPPPPSTTTTSSTSTSTSSTSSTSTTTTSTSTTTTTTTSTTSTTSTTTTTSSTTTQPPAPEGIVYVDINAEGDNDGSSWENAFTSLKEALNFSGASPTRKEVWVAAGTYPTTQPAGPYFPTVRFNAQPDTQLYGGFSGNETQRSQRNPESNETIMQGIVGELVGAGTAYLFECSSAVVDGFVLEGIEYERPCATAINSTVTNCEFRNHRSPTSSFTSPAIRTSALTGQSSLVKDCSFNNIQGSAITGSGDDNVTEDCEVGPGAGPATTQVPIIRRCKIHSGTMLFSSLAEECEATGTGNIRVFGSASSMAFKCRVVNSTTNDGVALLSGGEVIECEVSNSNTNSNIISASTIIDCTVRDCVANAPSPSTVIGFTGSVIFSLSLMQGCLIDNCSFNSIQCINMQDCTFKDCNFTKTGVNHSTLQDCSDSTFCGCSKQTTYLLDWFTCPPPGLNLCREVTGVGVPDFAWLRVRDQNFDDVDPETLGCFECGD